MKHIIKEPEPEFFVEWKHGESEDWKPSWKALDGERGVKSQLRKTLLKEQGYICCYCTMRINEENTHIEHFIPRSDLEKGSELELDYANLLASCDGVQEDPYSDKRHCNARKGADLIPISPTDEDCESYFRYDIDGGILPTKEPGKKERAEKTISTLNLNINRLRSMRKEKIDSIFFDEENNRLDLTHQEVELIIHQFNKRDKDGRFEPFCSAVISILQNNFL